MIDPVTFGLLSFGASALSSVGGFMGQQDKTAAQNQAAINQYRQRLAIHTHDTLNRYSQYNTKKAVYQQQRQNNLESAATAFQAEDMRLNEIFKQEAFTAQAANIQAQESAGKILAASTQGQSARRVANSVLAAQGRNQAVSRASLKSAQEAAFFKRGQIRDKLRIADASAYNDVSIAPTRGIMPLAPSMRSGPSPLGLAANLAGDALGAFNSFKTAEATW